MKLSHFSSILLGLVLLLAITITGTAGYHIFILTPKTLILKELSYRKLSSWKEDQHLTALTTFIHSCAKPAQSLSTYIVLQPDHMTMLCHKAQHIHDTQTARIFFETWFTPFQLHTHKGKRGLVTGYHTIQLQGSHQQSDTYPYPLYRLPEALRAKDPHYTRKAIQEGALEGKGYELIYVSDRIRAFFLHIQGSGVITLPDQTRQMVGYAGKNHHPYYAIGKYFLEKGIFTPKTISATKIQTWLASHPEHVDEILALNPSYIFFEFKEGEEPVGSQGVPLTSKRSIAIDPHYFPYGMPILLKTHYQLPLGGTKAVEKLYITQDSGSAIKGPLRSDIYFGDSEEAELLASSMNAQGEYIILLPNGARLGPHIKRH